MLTSLVVRIIGGVCGEELATYISDKIYYNKPQSPIPQITEKFENIIKDTKIFEEISNIQIQEYIDNLNKYNYEYDNEHGNTIQIRKIEKNNTEKELKFVNDDLYDDYFHTFIFIR